MEMTNEFAKQDKDLPVFGSWIWDCLSEDLSASHRKKEPNFNNLRRHKLQVDAHREPIRITRAGLRVMRVKTSNREYAFLEERPDGSKWVRLRISPNETEDIWLVVEGECQTNKGTYKAQLNSGHAYLFHKLVEEKDGWNFQTVVLNEKQGQLTIDIPYRRPAVVAGALDKQREMHVVFKDVVDDQGCHQLVHALVRKISKSREKEADKYRRFSISVNEPETLLQGVAAQAYKAGLQYGSVPKQYLKNARNKNKAYALRRKRIEKDFNHQWSRTLLNRAVSWGCGKIVVYGLPRGTEKSGEISGHAWAWYQFKTFLEYKSAEKQIDLAFQEGDTNLEELLQSVAAEGDKKVAQ
jgi:hypothetical protein